MKTEVIKIENLNQTTQIQKVADLLDSGQIIAFPTETVYGLGCKVDQTALKQLDELKKRSPDKRYTLHIGSHDQLHRYVPMMDVRAKKLVKEGLPGPLTIVFELTDEVLKQIKREFTEQIYEKLYANGTLGIRFPDNAVACAILSNADSAIIAPSANPADQEPATSSKQVLDYFDGQVCAVVDTPKYPCIYKQSSTVVKIGRQEIEILREGAISSDQVRRWSTFQILFVCTGNTCRSPMAEGFCRKYFSDILSCEVDRLADLGYKIGSAGIAGFDGMPASQNAQLVCEELQIDLSSHRSRSLRPQDIEQSDIIFTMTQSHRSNIIDWFPESAEKCFVLGQKSDIPDPVGMDINVYRKCFQQIQDNIIQKTREFL